MPQQLISFHSGHMPMLSAYTNLEVRTARADWAARGCQSDPTKTTSASHPSLQRVSNTIISDAEKFRWVFE